MTSLSASLDRWPLCAPFTISRRTFTDSLVLTVEWRRGGRLGRGECEPHEHDQSVGEAELHAAHALAAQPQLLEDLSRAALQAWLPNRPLRNALDCALWDLEAKEAGMRAWTLAGKVEAGGVPVMPTLGLDTPEAMAEAARLCRSAGTLKVKLGGADGLDADRLEAVAAGAPGVPLLVDVNGGWSPRQLQELLPLARRCGVVVIEQPLLPGMDSELPHPPGDLRFCADESCTDRSTLAQVRQHYQMINIKLDKTGGLTEALATADAAAAMGLPYMVGSNGGTSLAMAPLYVLALEAAYVDMGVAHLAQDREPKLLVREGKVYPPGPALWG